MMCLSTLTFDPDMDEFVENHLQQYNQEVIKYNTKIDAEKYPDLFAWNI